MAHLTALENQSESNSESTHVAGSFAGSEDVAKSASHENESGGVIISKQLARIVTNISSNEDFTRLGNLEPGICTPRTNTR